MDRLSHGAPSCWDPREPVWRGHLGVSLPSVTDPPALQMPDCGVGSATTECLQGRRDVAEPTGVGVGRSPEVRGCCFGGVGVQVAPCGLSERR